MAWTDRVREAAYTTPGGVRLTFDFENVSGSVEKNTVAYDFPGAAGTYIQDLGRSGRRLPLRMFVWGEDYDQAADILMDGLSESGVGKLEHPVYGVINVVTFGSINRRDDLKTAANQAVIEAEFWETTDAVFSTQQEAPAAAVQKAVTEYNENTADQYEQATDLDNTAKQSQLKGSYQLLLDALDAQLGAIANSQADVAAQYDAVRDSINASIDTLIGQPLTLAFQSAILAEAPARALTAITARLDAYGNLLETLTGTSFEPELDSQSSNQFHSSDLFAMSYVAGSVVSVINNQFETKSEAISAADVILVMMDSVTAWRDDQFEALGEIDTGEAYQQLLEAVGLAAGFLVQISFTLKQERSFVTVTERNFLELTAQLYGTTDDATLDFFIDSNSLTGIEIIEIPRDRRIVYYV
jgi:prophage DNA circulation protein